MLAFDPGLRHLAVVHVARSDAVPPPGVLCREPSETTEEYRARGLLWFLHFGWRVVEDHWDVLDVTDALGREEGVANVKGIMDATKAVALADTLEALQARWFPGPAVEAEAGPDPAAAAPPAPLPSRIVVEAQHNANAIMRGVAMGILVNFRRSMPRDVSLTMLSGSRKLGVCTALGVHRGDGLAEKHDVATAKKLLAAAKAEEKARAKAARAAARAAAGRPSGRTTGRPGPCKPPDVVELEEPDEPHVVVVDAAPREPEAPPTLAAMRGLVPMPMPMPQRRKPGGGLMRMSAKARDGYEDNKRRSVMAVQALLPGGHPILTANARKKDDLCDVLLMGLWALWEVVIKGWRVPPKPKAANAKTPKAANAARAVKPVARPRKAGLG